MDNSQTYIWCEQYRPKRVEDCLLPDRLKTPFLEYVKSKEIPNLLLHGSSGVGKTTIALALCQEIGVDYLKLNGSEERGIDTLRTKIMGYASSFSLHGGKKVIIIDEADYLSNEAMAAFRGVIEEFASNCSFIFTCNFKSKIIEAIHSRCAVVDFTLKKTEKQTLAFAFMKRAEMILNENNVPYEKPILAEIINKHFPDFRRTLNELQKYSKFGKIDVGILAQVKDVDIKEIMKFLKEKNFTSIRKWVSQNSDLDQTKIYRRIYDSLVEHLSQDSIPQAILHIAKYQFQAGFVADPEVNLVACLIELMVDCKFI